MVLLFQLPLRDGVCSEKVCPKNRFAARWRCQASLHMIKFWCRCIRIFAYQRILVYRYYIGIWKSKPPDSRNSLWCLLAKSQQGLHLLLRCHRPKFKKKVSITLIFLVYFRLRVLHWYFCCTKLVGRRPQLTWVTLLQISMIFSRYGLSSWLTCKNLSFISVQNINSQNMGWI